MKSDANTSCESHVARSLAAEDLRCGDFVAILHEVVEWPSFFWCGDPQLLPPDQPVRLVCRAGDGGVPLKVKAICLPFVFVKQPCGKHRVLDVRQHRLVRLGDGYCRTIVLLIILARLVVANIDRLSAQGIRRQEAFLALPQHRQQKMNESS
jgi:hypothetical protein